MDDAAIRHEIRRRKILQNSEMRMKKIMGLSNNSVEPDLKSSKPDTQMRCELSNDILPMPETSNRSLRDSTSKCNETPLLSCSNSTSSEKSDSTDEGRTCSNMLINGFEGLSLSEAYAFPKKVSDAETRSYGKMRADSRRNSSCKQMMMDTFQMSSINIPVLRHWLAIGVAFLVHFLRIIYNGSFLDNIFLPFLVSQLSVFFLSRSVPQVTTQSFLAGALLLCGVQPSIINRFRTLCNLVLNLLQDFSIYLFTLVLLHLMFKKFL